MEPVLWIIGIIAVFSFLCYLIAPPPPVAYSPPAPGPGTLTYCRNCGCNHRSEWMRWSDVEYHCTVCCSHLL